MPTIHFRNLTATGFEEFCFQLLRRLGFINLDWRKGQPRRQRTCRIYCRRAYWILYLCGTTTQTDNFPNKSSTRSLENPYLPKRLMLVETFETARLGMRNICDLSR